MSRPGTVGPAVGDGPVERPTWFYVAMVVAIALVTENANFEFTVIAGGLPDIAAEFGTTQVALVMTVVFVASLVFLPIAGRLSDVYGKKRVLLVASAAFMAGSVVCALAPTFPVFLGGRVLQSGFVIAYVTGYGLIRDLFPPRLVPLGVGALGIGTGVSVFLGPLIGGWLIDSHGFRSAFWFLAAYDVVVTVLLLFVVPESPVRVRRRIDVTGGLALGIGVAALVAGIVEPALLPVAVPAAVVLLALFWVGQRRSAEPLVDVRLVALPKVWLTLVAAGLAIFVSTGANLLMSQLLRTPTVPGVLENGLGWDALQYGVRFAIPFGVIGAVGGFAAGWVCRRYAPRTGLLIGVLSGLVAMVFVVVFPVGAAVAVVAGILLGIGLGFLYASANNLIIEAVPAGEQGVSTSLLYTALGVTQAISTAVLGAITAQHAVTTGGAVVISDAGYRISFLVLVGVSVAAGVATLLLRHGRTPASGGAAPDALEATGAGEPRADA